MQRNSTEGNSRCPFCTGNGREGQSREESRWTCDWPSGRKRKFWRPESEINMVAGLAPPGDGAGESASCFSLCCCWWFLKSLLSPVLQMRHCPCLWLHASVFPLCVPLCQYHLCRRSSNGVAALCCNHKSLQNQALCRL